MARAAVIAAALVVAATQMRAQAPDTIFFHGDIVTGNGLRPLADSTPEHVSAIAVHGGKVVAVGGDKEMLALKGEHTATVDLGGAFAMPGFNDAHTHIASAGQQRLSVDLDNVPSLAAMQAKVKAYAATMSPGQWIQGGGWDHTKWASKTLPTRLDVDAVTDGHPAMLGRTDGHIAVANTPALQAAGITDATPDPAGGKIDRDAAGHATGILREDSAMALVNKKIPPPTYEVRRKALELSIQDALSHGVTSVQDFSDWDDWLVLEGMEREGKLPLRVSGWIAFTEPIGVLESRRASHSANDPLLHLGFLKAFMDGSLGSRTASLNAPYADDASNEGISRFEQEKLNQMAAARAADGFQLGFHAIGDRANDMALNAFAAAEQVGRPANVIAPKNPDAGVVTAPAKQFTAKDFRFRIEHAQVISPGAFQRFADLGVIASMQPSHLLTDMEWARARLGSERIKRAYAWKSFLEHGVTLAFGTDYPVESISPFRGLYSAITRQNEAGTQTFEPQEKLTIEQAVYAYTQAPAFAEFGEHVVGVLQPGFECDFVVLDRDILKASPREVLGTKVLRTVVGGTTVYQAK